MKLRKNIKKILAVGCIALLGATLSGCQPAITIEDVNKAVAEKEAEMLVEKENAVSEAITNAVDGVDITSDNEQAINDAIGAITIESVPDALKEQILEDAKEVQEEVDAETELNGYDIDNLELGAEFDATVSDRDLKTLFDGELDFKGDDYDAEEILTLENLKIAINENDFGSVSYLQIPDEGIVYKFTIENSLDTSDIDEDDTLKFNFLGEEVEVSEWDGDTITFTKGIKHAMKEGEIFEVLDKTITMKTIGSDTIYIDVDGEVLFIDEDETKDVNGIEIKLVRVLDSDEAGSDVAELKIGEDVTNEIESGDEYSKDSIWEYVITSNSIGLTLTEEFKDIDDDEEYKALVLGEQVCLPNDFLCVVYSELSEEDMGDYDFELKTKSDTEYVEIDGDFLKGINDYDRIYVNETGIYEYKDSDMALVDSSSIEVADTELTLDLIGTNITIDDIKTNLDLDILEVAGVDISEKDDDYRTTYGAIIVSPEDNLEDNELRIEVPEEELEATITVVSK